MAKNENKTIPNKIDPIEFIESVDNEIRKEDSLALLEMMKDVTGEDPVMWGGSIIGFGLYRYKYKSGRKGEWMKVGFSPRKQSLTLYLTLGIDKYKEDVAELGETKTGVGCLYIKKLTDVDQEKLRKLIEKCYKDAKDLDMSE